MTCETSEAAGKKTKQTLMCPKGHTLMKPTEQTDLEIPRANACDCVPWNPIRENQKQDWSQGATLEPNKSWEHSWLYVKNAGTAHPLFIQIPDGLVVNLFKVSTMYIYIPKYPMYARWSNSHDPSWKFCKGEEWNQQSAGASCSAPCYRLSPGDWAVWYPNNWRTISGPSFWKWKPPLLLSYTPPPIFNKAHSDFVSPDSLGSKRNPSRFKRTTHRGFQPDVPSSPSLVVWVFPGLSENLPHHLIWLTPRWWSVDSCAPFCAFCVQDIRP